MIFRERYYSHDFQHKIPRRMTPIKPIFCKFEVLGSPGILNPEDIEKLGILALWVSKNAEF